MTKMSEHFAGRVTRILSWFGTAGVVACAGSADVSAPADQGSENAEGLPDVHELDATRELSSRVVFETVRREDRHGSVLNADLTGELDPKTAAAVARPLLQARLGRRFTEDAWGAGDASGNVEYGYRVREIQEAPAPGPPRPGGTRVTPELNEALGRSAPEAMLRLVLQANDIPEWDLPLRAASFSRSAGDALRLARERTLALAARAETAQARFAPIRALLAEVGARVIGQGRTSNWMTAEVPARSVNALVLSGRVAVLDLLGTVGGSQIELMGLGDMRLSSRLDADRFLSNGFTGKRSNPARHSHGDIVVGVIEDGLLADEACFLTGGATCSASRLKKRYRCDDADSDLNFCESIANFADTQSNSYHGTIVASVAIGDYRLGQADHQQLGDPGWVPGSGHPPAWRNSATGIAPEASVMFFGQVPSSSNTKALGYADAFNAAVDESIDITNSSWAFDRTKCSPTATQPHDIALEDAFDDGILNVVGAGNPNSPEDDSLPACNLLSPADLVKALTVNAVNGQWNDCVANYNDCHIDWDNSAAGGYDGRVGSQVFSRSVSGVDLVAPNNFTHTTSPIGTTIEVLEADTIGGTSVAAPVVAGAAALVKDWALGAGQTWINSPGRLHTMMLAMADRHRAPFHDFTSEQAVFGSDVLWGLGKLKLRLFHSAGGLGAWAYVMRTTAFVPGSSDDVFVPFATPTPTGTRLVKCVLMQDEDMSAKSTMSQIELEMRLRQPVSGRCDSLGSTTSTRIDSRVDYKKMGALESSDVTVVNRCLEVTLDAVTIDPAGVTVHAMCYYAGKNDDT
jgi:hypothetical protein